MEGHLRICTGKSNNSEDSTFKADQRYRNPLLMATHYAVAIVVAFVCGFFFYQVTNDIPGFQLVFLSLPILMLTAAGQKPTRVVPIYSQPFRILHSQFPRYLCQRTYSFHARTVCCLRSPSVVVFSLAHCGTGRISTMPRQPTSSQRFYLISFLFA